MLFNDPDRPFILSYGSYGASFFVNICSGEVTDRKINKWQNNMELVRLLRHYNDIHGAAQNRLWVGQLVP